MNNLLGSYKQRLLALLLGSIAFAFIAWWLSFGKSYQAYQDHRKMQRELAAAQNVDQEIAHYQKKLAAFNQDSSMQGFSQTRLFEILTDWTEQHRLNVVNMPEAIIVEEAGYQVFLNPIIIKGNFVDLVQLIYALEQEYRLGQVLNTDFKIEKNRESRKLELLAYIQLQNIQSLGKNEE